MWVKHPKQNKCDNEKLYDKINLLETNQKPKNNIVGGIIYFFKTLNNIFFQNSELC